MEVRLLEVGLFTFEVGFADNLFEVFTFLAEIIVLDTFSNTLCVCVCVCVCV